MSDVEVTIVFEKPSPNAPGHLRRMRRALELGRALQAKMPTPEDVDNLVMFLLPYVKEPVDRKEAEEALWDASEEQFQTMLAAMRGDTDGANPPSPPQSDSA